MRRMWAAGAAVVMSLVLGGAPGTAQQASGTPSGAPVPASAALVTGTADPCTQTPGTTTTVDGVVQVRDMVQTCTVTMTDPRVSGTSTNHINWDQPATGGYVEWGTLEIAGPDGTWVGPWVGLDPTVVLVAEGTGAYAGWTLVAHVVVGAPTKFDGLIYQGAPPTWVPLP